MVGKLTFYSSPEDAKFCDFKLGEVIMLQRGFDITKAEQSLGNVPIISSSGVSSYHNKSKVQAPGVVIGRKGTLGTVHFSCVDFWPHDTTLWVKEFKGNDPRFVYFFLKTLKLENFDTGSSNPTLNRNHAHKIKIRFPASCRVQKKIAAILSAYDDLIENNNRRIALLEKMAEELYREWFVRLRFPGHEQVKIERGVPEGWSIVDLGNVVADIIDYRGITPAKLGSNWQDDGIKALSALNVKNGSLIKLDEAKCVSEILYERWMRKELRKFDILLTSEAPLGQVYMLLTDERFVLSQRVFGIRANLKLVQPCYLYLYLLLGAGQNEITSKATGSTVGGIRQQLLRKVSIILPDVMVQECFADIVMPIIHKISALESQNQILSSSRDSLLPRLISGKLSVADLDIAFPPSMQEAAS